MEQPGWRARFTVHPSAACFPLMAEADLASLTDDIRKHGLREPIKLWRSADDTVYVLDGRNRLDALERLGLNSDDHLQSVQCRADEIPAFVIGWNVLRRHLTPAQRVELALQAVTAAQQFEQQHVRIPSGHKRIGIVRRVAEIARVSRPTAYEHIRAIAPGMVPTQQEIGDAIAQAVEHPESLPVPPPRANNHGGGKPKSLAGRIAAHVGVATSTVERHLDHKNGNGNSADSETAPGRSLFNPSLGKRSKPVFPAGQRQWSEEDRILANVCRSLERICGQDLTDARLLRRVREQIERLSVEYQEGLRASREIAVACEATV